MWLVAAVVCGVAECLLILVGCPKKGRGGAGGLWPSIVAMVPPPPVAKCFAHKKP